MVHYFLSWIFAIKDVPSIKIPIVIYVNHQFKAVLLPKSYQFIYLHPCNVPIDKNNVIPLHKFFLGKYIGHHCVILWQVD